MKNRPVKNCGPVRFGMLFGKLDFYNTFALEGLFSE